MRTAPRLLIVFGSLAAISATTFVLLWLYGVPMLRVDGIQSAELHRAELQIQMLADKEQERFEHWFGAQRRLLRLFARSLSRNISDPQQFVARRSTLARQLLTVQDSDASAYEVIYAASHDGKRLLASADPALTDLPPGDLAALEEAAQPGVAEYVSLVESGSGVAVLIANQISRLDADGNPDGTLLGLLVTRLQLMGAVQDHDASVFSASEGSDLLLLDRYGKLLAVRSATEDVRDYRYVGVAQAIGVEGLRRLKDAEGDEQIVVFRYLHSGASEGFSLALVRSARDVLANSRAAFWRVGLLGAVFFLTAMGVVLFAARRIERGEDEVLELNHSLEQRVAQRTAELETSNQRLTEAMEHLEHARDDLYRSEKLSALGALVAGVAHELNTPLGNALLAGSTLKEEIADFGQMIEHGLTRSRLHAHQHHCMEGAHILVSNLQRAAALITGFKQLSADQTSDQRRSFRLADVIEEVRGAMLPSLRHSGHRLDVDVADDIRMDSFPGPLGRIVVNFINNALLHAFPAGSHGNMRLSANWHDAEHVRLSFSDDGVGMPPDVARRVFDPFFTTRMGQGGSGLGMHIVHNLVSNVLGGEIHLDTAPGAGARFELTLPLQAPQSLLSAVPTA